MKIKKIIAGLMALTMCVGFVENPVVSGNFNTVSVSAEEETEEKSLENGLKYKIEGDHVVITGCDKSVETVEISAEIEGLPVTTIGKYAFSGCKSLTEITIPKSITEIRDSAFSGCKSLKEITIPDSVTEIGGQAFYECTGLTEITIPDSITSIGFWAFRDTAWYENQPDGLVYAGKVVYEYKGEMPENTSVELKTGTKGINDYAFSYCENLKEIIIPDSVTSIGSGAFRNCTSLTEITIPDSVTTIEYSAFENCTSLTEITIPDSVTSIGDEAFFECLLTEVTIPASVTEIGYYAFGYEYDKREGWEGAHSQIEGFKIYGYTGTAAEEYANENEFEFVSLGEAEKPPVSDKKECDIDGDGETTAKDALNILQIVVGEKGFSDEQKKLADIDGDGEITAKDALVVLQIVVGL